MSKNKQNLKKKDKHPMMKKMSIHVKDDNGNTIKVVETYSAYVPEGGEILSVDIARWNVVREAGAVTNVSKQFYDRYKKKA